MKINLGTRWGKKLQSRVDGVEFEVGVLDDSPHKDPVEQGLFETPQLKNYAGGPVRKTSRKTSGVTTGDVLIQNMERTNHNFLLEPFQKKNSEIMKFTNLVTVPFNVRYEYRGLENVKSEEGEKNCHKFISNYELNFGDSDAAGPRVFGYVTSIWFWDAQQGIPYYAQEEYNVIIVNEQGLANEFKIKSRSYYRKFRARNDAGKVALAERLKENLEKDDPQLNVRLTDNGVAISLPDLFFDTNSAKLSKPAKQSLEKIAQLLKTTDSKHVRVRGHTDSTGDETYNQQLSEKRAERVAEFLIDSADLNPDGISFDGKGAKDPVAENSTAEGRTKNRRVEIILLDR